MEAVCAVTDGDGDKLSSPCSSLHTNSLYTVLYRPAWPGFDHSVPPDFYIIANSYAYHGQRRSASSVLTAITLSMKEN